MCAWPPDGILSLRRPRRDPGRRFQSGLAWRRHAPAGRAARRAVLRVRSAAARRDQRSRGCAWSTYGKFCPRRGRARLRRLMSEIEMWLFEHAVNERGRGARRRGQRSVVVGRGRRPRACCRRWLAGRRAMIRCSFELKPVAGIGATRGADTPIRGGRDRRRAGHGCLARGRVALARRRACGFARGTDSADRSVGG